MVDGFDLLHSYEFAMAPPRPHTKSRTGCKTCRRRKVKCDEASPICRNCTRRGVECLWGDPPALPSSICANISPSMHSFPMIMSSTELDLQGIELIHQYTTSTCYTLCEDRASLDVWKLTLPRVAILPDNSFLLHAILAVAALHLFTLNPTHPLAVQYSCAAVSHYNQAVSTLPDSDLRGADDGTVFTAQLLIGIYGFATSPSVPVSSDWLRILRRTAPTFRNPLASLQYTVVAALIPWVTGPHDEDAGLPLTAFTQSLTTLPLPINGVPEIHEVCDAAVSATYQHAVRFLQKSLAASLYPDFHLHAAFLWFMLSSDVFMELLFERRPRALVLLGHYCAMMQRLKGPWWAQKDWNFELTRITSVLGDRWQRWTDWESSNLY